MTNDCNHVPAAGTQPAGGSCATGSGGGTGGCTRGNGSVRDQLLVILLAAIVWVGVMSLVQIVWSAL